MNRFAASLESDPQTFTDLAPRALTSEHSQQMTAIRQALLAIMVADYSDEVPPTLLAQVLIEAEALASLTPFPTLFLPLLVEEKANAIRKWAERQRQIQADQEQSFGA